MGRYKDPVYQLRLPAEVKAIAQKAAKDHYWSLNTYIQVAVKEKLEREGRLPETR